jgi:hypothetical protein
LVTIKQGIVNLPGSRANTSNRAGKSHDATLLGAMKAGMQEMGNKAFTRATGTRRVEVLAPSAAGTKLPKIPCTVGFASTGINAVTTFADPLPTNRCKVAGSTIENHGYKSDTVQRSTQAATAMWVLRPK